MKTIEILKEIFGSKYHVDKRINISKEEYRASFFRNNPVNEHTLDEFSGKNGRLPDQYVMLLSLSNGIELFNVENLGGLCLFPLEEVETHTNDLKEIYEGCDLGNILTIGKMISGNAYIGMRLNDDGCEVVDCYLDSEPQQWKTIATDLDEFLSKYLELDGKQYWIE